MAVVKATKGGKSLSAAMNYVEKKAELCSGKDCSDKKEKALNEMESVKELWGKTEGRPYKHYVQSFEPGEVDQETAHEIGLEWAEKNFPGHQAYVATHTDKEHIHNHVIVNSVNFENGKKLHFNKYELERFKSRSDEICRERGLSTIDRTKGPERGEIRTYSMKEQKLYEKAFKGQKQSYKIALAKKLGEELRKAKNLKELAKNMEKKGYKIKERGKELTFEDSAGNKVRASNLAKTFSEPNFTKEGILNELERNNDREYASESTGIEKSSSQGSREDSQRSGSDNEHVPTADELRKRVEKSRDISRKFEPESTRNPNVKQRSATRNTEHER